MTNQYDQELSGKYNKSDLTKNSHQMLAYETWLKVIGQVSGFDILDLACGSGFSSRLLAQKGGRVIGVDVSSEMIKEALVIETKEPFSISYICRDVVAPEIYTSKFFDKVVAAFLLHYAESLEVLENMVNNISQNLKTGGKFITINLSPDHPIISHQKGISHSSVWFGEPFKNGSEIEVTLWTQEDTEICRLKEYYWSKETYEKVLAKFGLKIINWHEIKGSTPENNMLVVIEAVKI